MVLLYPLLCWLALHTVWGTQVNHPTCFLAIIPPTTKSGGISYSEAYLQFLKERRLPPYELARVDDTYRLEFSGAWAEAIYWETLALSIVNKLYYRALLACLNAFERDVVMATGTLWLVDKITVLRMRPDIPFSDFGTRRRFSRSWQEYVIRMLAQEISRQLLGTSNTAMAMQYGLLPIGTLAHEMYIHGRAVIQLGPRGVHLRRYGRVNRNFASLRRRAADE